MDSIQEAVSCFSAATQKMQDFTKPLIKQGILHFSFIRSFDDGRFVNLSNIDGWIDYYYQQKLYLSSCFEGHPSSYFSQVFLWRDKLTGDVVDKAKKIFNTSNGVTIIDRKYNYTSFYFFSSSLDKMTMDNFYINNLEFLYQFIHQFEQEGADLIKGCISDDRRTIYDELYISNPLPDNIEPLGKPDLKKIRKLKVSSAGDSTTPGITLRESECLSCLLKGLSAKEIANIKCMSSRTVEHHINSLKDKFECKSSLALVSTLYTKHHHLAMSLLHANYV